MPTDRDFAPESSVDSGDASAAEAASRVASAPEATPEKVGKQPASPGPELESEKQEPAAAAEVENDEDVGATESPAESQPVDLEAVSAKAQKADEYLALAQRTQADFENYRKRTAREAAAAQQRGVMKLARELLPAVDNLERALAHADATAGEPADQGGNGSFIAGIKHVHTDVLTALARAGIEAFSPEGEPFNPVYHEAVAQQPVEGAEPGTVVEVYQRGYRIGDSVLRPARVLVAG
jgi:molecular chaperone GrpE